MSRFWAISCREPRLRHSASYQGDRTLSSMINRYPRGYLYPASNGSTHPRAPSLPRCPMYRPRPLVGCCDQCSVITRQVLLCRTAAKTFPWTVPPSSKCPAPCGVLLKMRQSVASAVDDRIASAFEALANSSSRMALRRPPRATWALDDSPDRTDPFSGFPMCRCLRTSRHPTGTSHVGRQSRA